MRRLRRPVFAVALAGAGLLASAGGLLADDRLRARAEREAALGRCDAALAALAELEATASLDARARLVAGQCQLRLQRYGEAVASLEQARAGDPRLPLVDLQLGIARFHAGDLAGADAALADARAAGSVRPELELYEALLALQDGRDPAGAARTLERLAREHPDTLDPAASYYAGLAWDAARDARRSRAALDGVARRHPGTPWASASARALAPSGRRVAATDPWVRLEAGFEWDSNVAYLGEGLATPEEIGSESDVRAVWSADAGRELWRRGPTSVGARVFYRGSAHVDARDYDLQSPGVSLWLDRTLTERSLLRLESGYDFAWLGYDPFVSSWWVTPQLFVDQGTWGTTRLYAGLSRDDFRTDPGDVADGSGVGTPCPPGSDGVCGPAGVDERGRRDRDGFAITAGVDHAVTLRSGTTRLRGGVFGERYAAEGRDWDFAGVGAHVGVWQALPWQLWLDAGARYVHRPFAHPSSYVDPRDADLASRLQYALPGRDRTDDVVEVDVRLGRRLGDRLSASLRYGWLRNASNVAVFDYDRHLVGAYLTWDWPGERAGTP